MSMIKLTFQMSGDNISLYLLCFISTLHTFFNVCLFVNNNILRIFDPVVDRTSFFIHFRRCFVISFGDLSICFRKLINLLISTNLRCFVSVSSSMKYLWVWAGTSNIILTAVFQDFSNISVFLENRSQRGLAVKTKF